MAEDNDLTNGTGLLKDVTATELQEKFDIPEETADKILKALPDLCKEFVKAQGTQQAPEKPDQQRQYPYPYPYPYPSPYGFPAPAAPLPRLTTAELEELRKVTEASAEEMAREDMISEIDNFVSQGLIDESTKKAIDELGEEGLNEVLDFIIKLLDELAEEEEAPEEKVKAKAEKALTAPERAAVARALFTPFFQSFRLFRQRQRQVGRYPYPYPYPYPAPRRQPARQRAPRPRLGAWLAEAKEGDTASRFTDSLTLNLDESSIKMEDGVLKADAVMTAAMVQDYSGTKVLKCPDELKKACEAWPAPIPITNTHPPDGIVTNQDEITGWATPPTWSDGKQRVETSVKITDGPLIDKVKNGKKDVSIGFFCDLDAKPGEFKGEKYDAVQRNIVFNHLACGVDKGRCPTGICGIGQDCESCDKKDSCNKRKDVEDVDVTTHEKLLKEKVDAIKGLSKKIQEGADTMKPDELNALISNLSDISYNLKQATNVIQTKSIAVDEQMLTDVSAILLISDRLVKDHKERDAKKAGAYMLEETAGHTHTVTLNEKGTGMSSTENGHAHEVKAWKAEETAGHTHKLKMKDKQDDAQKLLEEEKNKTIDAIMDFEPPEPREWYHLQKLDSLKRTLDLLKSQDKGGSITKSRSGQGKSAKDAAYAKLEEKLQGSE